MKKQVFWLMLIVLVAGPVTRYLLSDKPVEQDERRGISYKTNYMINSQGITGYEMYSSNLPENGMQSSEKTFVLNFGNVEEVNVDASDSGNVDANNEGIYILQTDRDGRLVLNEKTRLAIERLYVTNTPEELKEKLQEISKILPPDAHKEIVTLLDNFDKYTKNLSQAADNENRPDNVEDALRNLQQLHDQRIIYFGRDMANALFDKEESTSREMLELVYREKSYGM